MRQIHISADESGHHEVVSREISRPNVTRLVYERPESHVY